MLSIGGTIYISLHFISPESRNRIIIFGPILLWIVKVWNNFWMVSRDLKLWDEKKKYFP